MRSTSSGGPLRYLRIQGTRKEAVSVKKARISGISLMKKTK